MKERKRKKIEIEGIVQGVGFRPFVYREAFSSHLAGFVFNTERGLEIEAEGEEESLSHFIGRIHGNPPALARITRFDVQDLPLKKDTEFLISASRSGGERAALISPDIGICNDCLKELFDPANRRFHYPFINCTLCGPRYTIIQDIPYDRPNTTMRRFDMCAPCMQEYEDPSNRRFHAQPNACPECGPRIWLEIRGQRIDGSEALEILVGELRSGAIAAVKGLGGFHLACDASNDEAVRRLRKRKNKEEKPLAVMVPDLETAERLGLPTPAEKDLLENPRRPIVLVLKKGSSLLAESVSPGNTCYGLMLPYTPLHYLLMRLCATPLVMTSGNISEEPIAIDNEECKARLKGIADAFLMHDRDIHQRADDSVISVAAGLPRPVRRSRGMVPAPVLLQGRVPCVLALGGALKNTLCYTQEDRATLSQHIGDVENQETFAFFTEVIAHLSKILGIRPEIVAHDMHPDYLSTRYALGQNEFRTMAVQHHHAHIASCLADNGCGEKVIGLALDGTGYGEDGTVWGGEVLLADMHGFERAAHIGCRAMPGGDRAIREPWRMAISYLYSAFLREGGEGEEAFLTWAGNLPPVQYAGPEKCRAVLRMIHTGLNTVRTSSLGRLFDGVSAVLGLRESTSFEGQAAMDLEMAMTGSAGGRSGYEMDMEQEGGMTVLSPDRMMMAVVRDVRKGIPNGVISLRFHQGVVDGFVRICERMREAHGIQGVALSGGCFQNRFLLDTMTERLNQKRFRVLSHVQVPANDGGLSLGQALIAASAIGFSGHFARSE